MFGKLKTSTIDLEKLSYIVDNDVVKNTKFNTLKTIGNSLEKNILDATTKFSEKIGDVDKKIPDTRGLVTATILNTKNSDVDNKIADTSNLVTTTDLKTKISEVENKIPNHDKYITTPKLTAELFAAKSNQANLVTKTDFDNKLISYDRQITSNKTKYLEIQKKLNNLITND